MTRYAGDWTHERMVTEIIRTGVGPHNAMGLIDPATRKQTISYVVGTCHGWLGGGKPYGQVTPKGIGLWADFEHDPRTALLFLTWPQIVRIVEKGAIPEILDRLEVLGAQRIECIDLWQDRYYRLNRESRPVCLYKRDVVEHEMQVLGGRLLDHALEIELASPAVKLNQRSLFDDQLSLF